LTRIAAYLRSNVLGVIAIFIALGAGAYAAGLPKDSVKSKQIKAGAVKKKELAGNAVTSPKVANGSLLGEDFAAGQLPAGATGPTGPRGPSQLLFDTGSSGGGLTTTSYTTSRQYEIPAGAWWVSWSAMLDTPSGVVQAQCKLVADLTTVVDERKVGLDGVNDSQMFVLEGKVTGPVRIGNECRMVGAGTANVRDFKFFAITADQVTNLAP
jgi:hypothetical protein